MTAEDKASERLEAHRADSAPLKAADRERARVEEQLRKSEERYRELYDNTPVMMHSIDHEGRLVSVNDYWLKVMGYERSEVLGRQGPDFLTQESRRYALETAIPRLRKTGVVRDIELQLVKKNAEVIDVLLSATAEFDEQGRVHHSLAFIVDVTDRKRAQAALQESEARFRVLVEHAADGFFLIAPDGGFVDVNQCACDSLGYTREELLSLGVPDISADAERERKQFFETRDRMVAGVPITIEAVLRRKDGSTYPAEVRLGPFEKEGQTLEVALARDITERKKAEAALRESEERFAGIFRSAMDAIVIVDAERCIRMFNEAAEKVFRCPAAHAIGQPFERFLSQEFRSALEECIQAFSEEGIRHRYLWAPDGLTATRADGEEFPVEATISRVEIGGQELCTIILRDINDRKRAEAELRRLQREKVYLQEELSTLHKFEEMVGSSAAIRAVFEDVEKVAATDSTVLITGETGTGKELVARAIHNASDRRDKVLVTVNCASLPAALIESELFGHEKGAFTGASSRRIGRFELADGGSIFLDEVGDLPLDLQAKLLRVLQEGEFERVGGSETKSVDVRVIAATNRDLETAVKEERFRPDLYYRLNVFPIRLPALRERKEDIPLLVRHFVMKYATKLGRRIDTIPEEAMGRMRAYGWPGNVRELENVLERAVILSRGSTLQLGGWLPAPGPAAPGSRIPTLEELERRHIIEVLELTGWRVRGERGSANLLGLKPTTLEARMKKLKIKRGERSSNIS